MSGSEPVAMDRKGKKPRVPERVRTMMFLLEQIDVIERALAVLNTYSTQSADRFALSPQRLVPQSAVREAILKIGRAHV